MMALWAFYDIKTFRGGGGKAEFWGQRQIMLFEKECQMMPPTLRCSDANVLQNDVK